MKFQFTKEHLFYIGCSFIILLINTVPYLFAFLFPPNGRIFSGQLFIYYDVPTYYAKMLAGFEGSFVYHNFFTTETPNPDIPIYLFYNFLGHLTRIIHVDIPIMFFGARIFFGAVLLGSISWFLMVVVPHVRIRILSFCAICFASGFGWVFFVLYILVPFSLTRDIYLFPDLLIPEFIPFARFAFHPHILFAHTLLLISLICAYRILTAVRSQILYTLVLAVSLSVLVLILPFHLPVACGILGSMIWYAIFTKKSLKQIFLVCVACLLSLIPFIWMYSLLFVAPLWNIIEKQNSISPLPFYSLIIGWGLCGIFALQNIVARVQENKFDLSHVIIVVWVVISVVLMYVTPFPMRRRFIETGVFVPVAVLAVQWFFLYIQKIHTSQFLKKWIIISCISVSSILSGFGAYYILFLELTAVPVYSKIFYSQKTLDALEWISYNTHPESIVLGSLQTGNIIPYYARRTTYFGHIPETLDGGKKNIEVEKFYSGIMNNKQAQQFLLENRISIIVVTEHEQEKIRDHFFPYPFLKKIYANNEAIVYTVFY